MNWCRHSFIFTSFGTVARIWKVWGTRIDWGAEWPTQERECVTSSTLVFTILLLNPLPSPLPAQPPLPQVPPTAPYPPLHNPFLTGTLITNLPNNRRANVRAILVLAGMRAKRSWVKAHDVLTTWFFAKWNSHVELICLVSGQQYNQLRHFVKFWLYFLRVIVLRILE